MEFNSRVKPAINGTRWTFNNEDGMEIDLAMIPKMTSEFYSDYLDSQANKTTNSTIMYKLGEQLGLGQKLFATRAAKVPSSYTGLYVGLSVAGFLLISFAIVYTLKSRQQKTLLNTNSQVTVDTEATQENEALN